ncbi:MAG: DNA polymerase III subunit delta' [Alphaproteobacteria bacterium]|nr:DNA polymerase III subunit delta' [Alphaproteobacteria bacterium]
MEALTPRDTQDLLGHEEAEQRLLDGWRSGRLAHAWLIGGPRGIGKATLAYRFARFVLGGGEGSGGLFGPVTDTLHMAPDHPIFRHVASGTHADLKVVERGWSDEKPSKRRTEILVKDVREIGAFLSLTPAGGGWRVVIVDTADEMNRNAANALLKVLEEPPRRALLLLVSHSPGGLLPTLRSRCRALMLRPLAVDLVEARLREWRPELSSVDASALARLGEGSLGRVLALADSGGLTLYRDMIGLLSGLPRMDAVALHAFIDRVAKTDSAYDAAAELLVWWLARVIRGGACGIPEPEVVMGEGGLADRLARGCSLDQWVEVWEKITRLFVRADAVNLDPRQVMLGAFLAVEKQVRQ